MTTRQPTPRLVRSASDPSASRSLNLRARTLSVGQQAEALHRHVQAACNRPSSGATRRGSRARDSCTAPIRRLAQAPEGQGRGSGDPLLRRARCGRLAAPVPSRRGPQSPPAKLHLGLLGRKGRRRACPCRHCAPQQIAGSSRPYSGELVGQRRRLTLGAQGWRTFGGPGSVGLARTGLDLDDQPSTQPERNSKRLAPFR
jgi:hypothetical protein